MTGLIVFIALACLLAAVGFFMSARSARATSEERAQELERWRAEAEKGLAELGKKTAELKERKEEVTALKEQLREVKKRAFDQKEATKRLGGEAALRDEIDKLGARLEQARADLAHQADVARASQIALEKAEKELERLRAAPSAPAPAAAAAPAVDGEKLAAERERADAAERKLVDARRRIAELERDLKNARGRLETEKRVYIVQKGELELAQDRHAELRRRYDRLRRDHDELIDAVRQAAAEDRKLAGLEAKANQSAAGAVEETAEPVDADADAEAEPTTH
jgi:chromosome segregation ATPase